MCVSVCAYVCVHVPAIASVCRSEDDREGLVSFHHVAFQGSESWSSGLVASALPTEQLPYLPPFSTFIYDLKKLPSQPSCED